ncbi:MAG TPA: substrate-binding domain-containing protein [Gaiellaceae bacterium]|nr:substrate-binding domain-containing protein [Gaiellaceae bacterium]
MWLLVIALVAGLSLVAAGCGGDDDDEGTGTDTTATSGECDKSVWVLLPDAATSPRWETDDRRYFEEELTEAGVDFTIVNSEGQATTQQSQAEQAINDDAGVVILSSNDSGSGATIIEQLQEADVPVIEYDRFNTGGPGGDAYVSFDNVAVGATMAETLEPEIDALDVDTPAVFMLNGGEEDNNAFLFRDGYAATVEAKVDAGDWELVDDQFVPGWGANGEGQQIMEQVLTDNNNKVDAVFAANDNLATQAINALEAAGVGPVPMSGQDASAAGIQQIILGTQTMTVYKPIQAEADVAAKAALALCAGETDLSTVESEYDFATIGINAEDGKPADTPTGEGVVPYLALTPIGVTEDNIMDTVIADEFRTIEEVCTGDTADTDFCKENG